LLALPDAPAASPSGSARRVSSAADFLGEIARAYRQLVAASGAAPAEPGEVVPTNTGMGFPLLPGGTLHDLIAAAAHQEGVSPALLTAVAAVESGFQPRAVSRAGATGLTQLMDGTARALGVTNRFDPWQNLVGGARYLRGLINRFPGNLPLALAAYNAGPGAVDSAGGRIPPYAETEAYVQWVLAAYRHYAEQPSTGGVT
jgi:hypothetical protein